MGDRIKKILAKLSAVQRQKLIELIELIISARFSGLDMKKLKGHANAYRVRKGDFRVIFTMTDRSDIRIIALERRTDTTYNEF
jgi:mRNA-degrading endonuclease RelE of RelBE toxin-antitoxin system